MSRRALTALLVYACSAHPAIAEPCREAVPVSTGQPSPCSGVLLPDDMARDTLRLVQVEIPMLETALKREEALHRLDLERDEKIKASLKAALTQTAGDTSGSTMISVAIGAAALILGAIGGYLAGQ